MLFFRKTLAAMSQSTRHTLLFSSVGLIFLGVAILGWMQYRQYQGIITVQSAERQRQQTCLSLTQDYTAIKELIAKVKTDSPELDLKADETALDELKQLTKSCDLDRGNASAETLRDSVNQKIDESKKRGTIKGTVTEGKTPLQAEVQLVSVAKIITKVQSDKEGVFSQELKPGTYTVKVALAGYADFSQEVSVTHEQTTTVVISLTKAVMTTPTPTTTPKAKASATPASTPTPTPVPVEAFNDENYSKSSIETERGSYTVHLLKFDTATTEMRVDTAADGDCADSCPVKSLASYVGGNGAVAGIHGTYFCPTSYKDCSGKTNSFYFKVYNGRLNKQINWTNGLGDFLPFLMIDQAGKGKYFSSWSDASALSMKTGISSRPNLITNGQVVLKDSDLDSDKERYTKGSRGFIGLKGQTIYAAVVLSATVTDSAYVAKALGLDSALNLDGGGSTALYYGGAYKVGPGRELPNAVVFIKK